jgi:hypothetical protein
MLCAAARLTSAGASVVVVRDRGRSRGAMRFGVLAATVVDLGRIRRQVR